MPFDKMKILFFIGKGGVGKSTISALSGLHFAKSNTKVLITSLDPAHNQSDIFETEPTAKKVKISENLELLEIDQQKWIKNYLKESEKQFSKAYAYLTTFSLEKHFSVLQYAPGIEEYALIQAFSHTLNSNKDMDIFIFDMPPTALTLKFFALADISLLWLKKLFDLRSEIEKKQEIISRLSLGKIEIERDRVMQNIQQQMEFWTHISQILRDQAKTFPVLVTNPDSLSVAEGKRIMEKLGELKIQNPVTVVNKTSKISTNSDTVFNLPVFEKLIGLNNLIVALRKIDFSVLDNILK